MRHSLSAGIHRAAYIQTADPEVSFSALLQPEVLWIDTTSSPYSLKKRNAGNTGWDAVPLMDAASAPFVDSTAIIKGSADATKLLRIEVDGFTTLTTRVLTAPNYDGTIATLAGSETLTSKSLTAPIITDYIDVNEAAAPGTPASGKARLYVKTDGLFYSKDDAGVETALGAGGGGGAWSALTAPSGNLSLAMAANLTALTWASNFGSSSAFKLEGNHSTPTGPLFHLKTNTGNSIVPLLVEVRGANQRLKVGHLGDVVLGQGGIGGTDTDGWVYVPSVGSNAFPSSTPTGQVGFAPIAAYNNGANGEYDLAIYLNSRWIGIGGARRRIDTGSGNGSQTLDFNKCQGANVTRIFTASGGNVTFTAWNNEPPAGSHVTVVIVQDATGGRTVTWPSTVKWPAGTAPTLTATGNKRDAFVFVWDGSFYYNVSQSLNL